jgi:hypothetical protein
MIFRAVDVVVRRAVDDRVRRCLPDYLAHLIVVGDIEHRVRDVDDLVPGMTLPRDGGAELTFRTDERDAHG